MRDLITKLVESSLFKRAVVALIILNAITLGMETSPAIMAEHGEILHHFDRTVLGIFIIELLLRLYAHRMAFIKDPWSLFDAAIIGIALLPHGGEFAVLRTLRVLRVLRLISMVPSMRRVVSALISSLSGVAAVAAIMTVIFYVFAVIATTLFAPIEPEYFDTLGNTLLTLFQIMTLEGWSDIARPVMAALPHSWIFFVSYILISTFVIMNLFIGVMVYAIQQSSGQYSGPERRRATPEQKAALKLLDEGGLIDEIKALRREIAEIKSVQKKQGFTLLEMSIVLTVIGLIVGSVLVGQSLIHTAGMNNLIVQVDKYKTATDTFRTKYESLPGDMPDAYNLWGAAAGCTNALVTSSNTGCNGNGDNSIAGSESFRYWHHMYLAGFGDGTWKCAVDVSTCSSIPGTFGPEIKLDRRSLGIYVTIYPMPSNPTAFPNTFQVAGSNNGDNVYDEMPALIPVDAQRLDTKIDDGLPELGKMQAMNNNNFDTGDCVKTTSTPHSYDLTNNTTIVCNVWISYE